ncbi:MAG: DNA polymerase III subunit delta [Actinobacteria bacterium]|nr:DNA polymerase III subunit delta [Actinomycetota bacterium]
MDIRAHRPSSYMANMARSIEQTEIEALRWLSEEVTSWWWLRHLRYGRNECESDGGVMATYLLFGSEEVLADRALREIESEAVGAEKVTLDGGELAPGDFSNETAPSLFGQERLVVLRELQEIPEETQEEILRYLADEPSDITLVLIHPGGIKGKAFIEKLKKAKVPVIACEAIKKDGEKIELVKSEALDRGRKISNDGARALVDAAGSEAREMISALHQLVSDTTGVIEVRDVNALFAGRVETTSYAVADAILESSLGEALVTLRQALDTGVDPVVIVNSLASSLRTLAKVGSAPRSARAAELAPVLGMAPWQVDKARRQLAGWNGVGITQAINAIARADSQVKGGGSDPAFACEAALMAIAAARNG